MTLATELQHLGHHQGPPVCQPQTSPVFGLMAAAAAKISVLELDATVEVLRDLGHTRQGIGMVRIVACRTRDTDRSAGCVAQPRVDRTQRGWVAYLDGV